MTGDSSSDLLDEYVTLLREFGLPPADVRELHADENAPSDAPLREFVARRVDGRSREALFSDLVETLTQSRRGISATASYWNYAPEVHLDEVFEPYGCSVTFRDAAHGGDGASVEIDLEDAGGSSHTMRFEYPDTPLGDDNLPALLDAVERELLADTDLAFALLSDIDRRWRVVLLESDRLAELRRRRGDRIEFAGRPLLAADQPRAYASGESADAYPNPPETPAETARPERTTTADDARNATVDPADLLADGDAARIDDAEPTADPGAVLDASPAEVMADGAAEASGPSGTGVEASDRELKRVFGDLSDVSLEPTVTDETGRDLRPNDPPVLELGTGADPASNEIGSSGGSATDRPVDGTDEEPDAIDGLFEELERKAITGDGGASGGGTAVVAGAASPGGPTADRGVRGEDEDDPTPEELLAAAEGGDADSLATAGDGDADSGAATDDGDEQSLAPADEGDAPGEFEWLSDQELAERE